MVEQPQQAISQDGAGRTFILGLLWQFAKMGVPTWCPGKLLYDKSQLAMRKDVAFADEREFRAFMASMVDVGLVQEKYGKTRIEPELKNLRFALSNWLHAICVGIQKEAIESQR